MLASIFIAIVCVLKEKIYMYLSHVLVKRCVVYCKRQFGCLPELTFYLSLSCWAVLKQPSSRVHVFRNKLQNDLKTPFLSSYIISGDEDFYRRKDGCSSYWIH